MIASQTIVRRRLGAGRLGLGLAALDLGAGVAALLDLALDPVAEPAALFGGLQGAQQ